MARRYETGFNGYGGSSFSTAAQYTAFANTTMLQRLATFIANGRKNGGNAPVIGEWGLAGASNFYPNPNPDPDHDHGSDSDLDLNRAHHLTNAASSR